MHREIKLAIAIDLNFEGLLAAVTRNAGDMSVSELAEQFNKLATRAKSNNLKPDDLQDFEVNESVDAAQLSKITAVRDIIQTTPPHDIQTLARTLEVIIDGASPEDATVLRNALIKKTPTTVKRRRNSPDEQLSGDWR